MSLGVVRRWDQAPSTSFIVAIPFLSMKSFFRRGGKKAVFLDEPELTEYSSFPNFLARVESPGKLNSERKGIIMLGKSSFYVCAAAVLAAVFVGSVAAEKKTPDATAPEPLIKGEIRHTVIVADGSKGKVFKISPEGKIVWEFKAPRCHDAWMLPNGNVLAAYAGRGVGGAMEISPDKKIVWKYESKGEVHAVQRLADGNTLMGDPARGRLIEISKEGKIVKEVKLNLKVGGHGMMRDRKSVV